MSVMLALVPGLPLAMALLIALPVTRAWAERFAPIAMLPALGVALIPPDEALALDWLLLGTQFGLDATGRIFLLFSALVWTLAVLYARAWLASDSGRTRFTGFFLAAAAGNLGVCVAQDVVGFYFLFALMTFSAYGLIVHHQTPASRRAGTVYLVLAVLGEAAVLVALLMIAATSGLSLAAAPDGVAVSPWRDVIVALLLLGFGVKIGVLGLHVALPLAYGATPVPGAAVLASAMIKAGLLGWLRFLPLGYALPEWSTLFIVLGLAAAFYGIVVGLLQREPKVILAYSSVSQMGLITAGVGLGLASSAAGAPALAAVTVYALHHALVKGALFFGEGLNRAARVRVRAWTRSGLVLLALVLAGAPFTSGALAKVYLKDLAAFVPWAQHFNLVVSLAAIGTTLLMAHFLAQVWRVPRNVTGRRLSDLALPAAAMVAAVLAAAWLVLPVDYPMLLSPAALGGAAWPVAVGAGMAMLAVRLARRRQFTVPPGDVLVPIELALRRLVRLRPGFTMPRTAALLPTGLLAVITRTEEWLGSWRATGASLLVLLGVILVLLALA